jgi:hypothetical protein
MPCSGLLSFLNIRGRSGNVSMWEGSDPRNVVQEQISLASKYMPGYWYQRSSTAFAPETMKGVRLKNAFVHTFALI